MKAQSSVEFIMNYSWMLAIVGVVVAALFALGFFTYDAWGFGSGKSGFGDLAPMDNGWKVDGDGTFFVKLRNNAGVDLKLWQVEASLGDITKVHNYGGDVVGAGGDSELIEIPGVSTLLEEDDYSVDVRLVYGTSDINFTSEGIVWGIVGR